MIEGGAAERALPPAVAGYRAEYRAKHLPAGYRGELHLAGTILLPLSGILVCAALLEDVRALEWLAVPLSALYANIVEYVGHRGPMHHPVRGLERHARQHHRFFTHEAMQFESSADHRAVLFPLVLVLFYFGLFGAPTALLLGWLFTPNTAWLFLATGLAYYLNYELLHYAYHSDPHGVVGRLPGLHVLRRLHTRHHDPALMQRYNFNITYPVGDWLFRTLYRKSAPG